MRPIKSPSIKRGHICYQCNIDSYPTGKPILDNDKLAEPLPGVSGKWICGSYVIEELNKRKMKVLGLQHIDVQAFIQKEDNDCKHWNNYVKRVNQTMGAGLKYQKNKYTGRTPF
jgi:hypothetical protein